MAAPHGCRMKDRAGHWGRGRSVHSRVCAVTHFIVCAQLPRHAEFLFQRSYDHLIVGVCLLICQVVSDATTLTVVGKCFPKELGGLKSLCHLEERLFIGFCQAPLGTASLVVNNNESCRRDQTWLQVCTKADAFLVHSPRMGHPRLQS